MQGCPPRLKPHSSPLIERALHRSLALILNASSLLRSIPHLRTDSRQKRVQIFLQPIKPWVRIKLLTNHLGEKMSDTTIQEPPKPFYLSKTVWTQVIAIIVIISSTKMPNVAEFLKTYFTEVGTGWVIINTILRAITKDKISLT